MTHQDAHPSPPYPLRLGFGGEADAVSLRTFMPRFPSRLPFARSPAGGWELALDVPHDVRIEYMLEIERAGRTEMWLDPANPHKASNPFGTNSVLIGPQWRRVAWMRREVEHGELREIRVMSRHLEGRRHHLLYTPPELSGGGAAPLLLVHDGRDYVSYAGLLRCVDLLIRQRRIDPVRVVGLNPGPRQDHYAGSPAHAAHVVEEVLPHVRARVPDDGRLAIMGASLGAVAAWHTAWAHPGVFGAMFLQSGTFALEPHPELTSPMFESITRFVRAALDTHRLGDVRIMQSCGRYESLIGWNRTVADRFAATTPHHRFVETWSGHDWGAWSGDLAEGLVHLFGVER